MSFDEVGCFHGLAISIAKDRGKLSVFCVPVDGFRCPWFYEMKPGAIR